MAPNCVWVAVASLGKISCAFANAFFHIFDPSRSENSIIPKLIASSISCALYARLSQVSATCASRKGCLYFRYFLTSGQSGTLECNAIASRTSHVKFNPG